MHPFRFALASLTRRDFIRGRTSSRIIKYHKPPRILSKQYLTSRHYSELSEQRGSRQDTNDQTENPSASTATKHDGADASADPETDIKAKLLAKEAEVIDLTARLRYSQADYQNLQRIAAKEKEQARDYAITRFATDLLETLDVLSLALQSIPPSYVTDQTTAVPSEQPEGQSEPLTSPTTPSPERAAAVVLQDLYKGVSLTHRQLLSTLAKHGMTPFDPIDQKFDPNLHEALYAIPMPGKETGTVIETRKPGYILKGRVLRAAQVGIVQEPQ